MDSWQMLIPDYTFICWSESNFDVNSSQFCKEAYQHKKWAFVADYVRLYVLDKYGGVYLDTDVMLLKLFDHLLEDFQLVLGTEDMGGIITSFIASIPNHPFIRECLDFYNQRSFLISKKQIDTTPNNRFFKKTLTRYGFNGKNERQMLRESIILYPDDVLHVKSLVSGKFHLTENSYMIHYHTLTWVSKRTKMIFWVRIYLIVPLVGVRRYYKATVIVRHLLNGLIHHF
jgi:mannosyltransferase OCH1-like enzyme